MLHLSGTGETHVGLVRANNEDSAFVGPYCLVVADGVGGGAAGEIASASTTYAVAATALQHSGEDPRRLLRDGVRSAQERLAAGVADRPEYAGMATTLTAVVTDGTRFTLAQLGDSRAYLFRAGTLTRLSRDHTYVQDLIDEGRLAPEAVAEHPWRNVVLRTVNGDPRAEPDLIDLDLRAGDRLLLASDGLTDLVPEDELARTLARRSDDDAVPALIAMALARGGRDNVTCLLATVVAGPRVSADGRLIGAVCDPQNVVDPAPAPEAHRGHPA